MSQVCRSDSHIRNPRAYIYKIVKRGVADSVQRYRRREQAHCPFATKQLLPDCADAVISRLAVRRAVRALPLQQRAAVWATQAMDQPQAEYAAAAGRAPGTVGVHVMRAVRVLRAGTGGYCRRSRCDGVRPGRRGDPPLLGGQQARPPARREGRVIDWLATVATVIGLTMAGIVLLSLTALGITRGTARKATPEAPWPQCHSPVV
ncbi:sigma factor-like helix-turn-helix DNA-binding protein [Streptomyces sp. KL116D]|uniref:sigma factor-like helix-turn-helix DNA-binding protein n=1 Tax=Streptomyces sp. KL116D TaxID=3045152 RepID=UPI0035582D97